MLFLLLKFIWRENYLFVLDSLHNICNASIKFAQAVNTILTILIKDEFSIYFNHFFRNDWKNWGCISQLCLKTSCCGAQIRKTVTHECLGSILRVTLEIWIFYYLKDNKIYNRSCSTETNHQQIPKKHSAKGFAHTSLHW